jgi:hypothetical protein
MTFISEYTKYLYSLYVYAEDDKDLSSAQSEGDRDEDNDEVDDEEDEEDDEVLIVKRT